MGPLSRMTVTLSALAALAAGARADQYWIAYEGNDFPENEGWERIYGDENGPQQGGSNRSIMNGWLALDSRRHHLIYDSYFWHRQLNPDPGELFVCEWRVNIIQNEGTAADSRLAIARDGRGSVGFQIGYDYIRSSRENWIEPIEPGIPHSFRVESTDMLTYSLRIDGVFAWSGAWDLNSLNESYVAFGDSVMGGGITSISSWDYVRFGVIPEPGSASLVGTAIGLLLGRRRTHDSTAPRMVFRADFDSGHFFGTARCQRVGRRKPRILALRSWA